MHWPLLQKLPAGQLTFAQAVGCVTGCTARQVPSGWQMPSPQSESRTHRPVPPGPTLQSSVCGSQACDGEFLPTHPASKQTDRIASFPHPIPHLRQAQGKVGRTLPAGKLAGVRQRTIRLVRGPCGSRCI